MAATATHRNHGAVMYECDTRTTSPMEEGKKGKADWGGGREGGRTGAWRERKRWLEMKPS